MTSRRSTGAWFCDPHVTASHCSVKPCLSVRDSCNEVLLIGLHLIGASLLVSTERNSAFPPIMGGSSVGRLIHSVCL